MNMTTFKTNLGKAAPYIAFGTGVASLIGAIGTAIYATTKLSYILDEHETEAEEIAVDLAEETEGLHAESPAYKDAKKKAKKRTRLLNVKTLGKIGKNYSATMVCTSLSIASFSFSFGKMRSNYLTTAATLGAVSTQFDNYRDNVREDAGVDKDREYYYDLKKEKVTVEETDPETGKVKKTKKELLVGKPTGLYSYRWKPYDWRDKSGSTQSEGNNIYDISFIKGIVSDFQKKLDNRMVDKIKFDDFLEELGFEHDSKYHEIIAGWLPGDTILCGLEGHDENGNELTLTEDAYNFIVGKTNEVTLTFNPRPDVYGVIVLETELGISQQDYLEETSDPRYEEHILEDGTKILEF